MQNRTKQLYIYIYIYSVHFIIFPRISLQTCVVDHIHSFEFEILLVITRKSK